jgi:hypothetical protein
MDTLEAANKIVAEVARQMKSGSVNLTTLGLHTIKILDAEARDDGARIIQLLRDHLANTPNDRTDKAVTSYRYNRIANGILEAIEVVAKEYKLDIPEARL